MDIRSQNAHKKENMQYALSLLDRVGLMDKANAYPWQLSGGQCQRVAIARALALKPAVLCFDEPTSALDPLLTQEVLSVIKSLKSKDMTMIIVTHEMNFARSVSDCVAYMSDGIIAATSSPEYIFSEDAPENVKAFIAGAKQDDF